MCCLQLFDLILQTLDLALLVFHEVQIYGGLTGEGPLAPLALHCDLMFVIVRSVVSPQFGQLLLLLLVSRGTLRIDLFLVLLQSTLHNLQAFKEGGPVLRNLSVALAPAVVPDDPVKLLLSQILHILYNG